MPLSLTYLHRYIFAISIVFIIKKVGTPDQATHETGMVKLSADDNIDKSCSSWANIDQPSLSTTDAFESSSSSANIDKSTSSSSPSSNVAQRAVATACELEAASEAHDYHGSLCPFHLPICIGTFLPFQLFLS